MPILPATSRKHVFLYLLSHFAKYCLDGLHLFLLGTCLWEESHAYDKGKFLVFSKVPLPDYRADLDERHGSAQKEVQFMTSYSVLKSLDNSEDICFHLTSMQIMMSTETERRVENLLARSTETSSANGSSSTSSQISKQSLPNKVTTIGESTEQVDGAREKISLELRDLQNSKKVHIKVANGLIYS